jgi:translation initiation factor 2-alpha kinase 3
VVHTQEESDVFERGLLTATPPRHSHSSLQGSRKPGSPSTPFRSPQSRRSGLANSESENNQLVTRPTGPSQTHMPDLDAIVYIKMDLYPMTLEEFLWAGLKGESGDIKVQHCFHIPPAVRILSAILDGVEYIHSQGMVHRDLKPGNILLSIHRDRRSTLTGSIDICNCSECSNSPEDEHTYITPHIGDFGLVAEIRKPQSDSVRTPRGEHVFEPTELARLAPAGSKFYLPQAPVDVICPKLDVYSLGVITLELLYKFRTKTERVLVLERLKLGSFNPDFEKHEMASGVKAMTRGNRDERWACADVRKWLDDTKRRYGQV